MDVTDEQWKVLEPLIGEMPPRADTRGRPWRRSRAVLTGIGGILRTGAPWADRPERYPPSQTCHRRFQRGVRDGTLERGSQPAPALCESGGSAISPHGSVTAPSWGRKRGRLRGSDQAGHRHETPGTGDSGRPCWSSFRRLCRLGSAARGDPRRPDPRLPRRR